MVLYTYSRDIPATNNNPSEDQPDMAINTNSIDDLLSQDHFNFNVANGGIHKQVRMPQRGGNPGTIPAGLIAQEGTIYTKQVTSEGVSTETGLFYTPDTSTNEYQLTRPITAKFASFGTNAGTDTSGWTFLPGGLILQYGLKSTVSASGTATTITFPVAFTSTPFSITIGSVTGEGNSPGANNQFVKDGTVSTTQFQIVNSSGSSARKVYWQAIGV